KAVLQTFQANHQINDPIAMRQSFLTRDTSHSTTPSNPQAKISPTNSRPGEAWYESLLISSWPRVARHARAANCLSPSLRKRVQLRPNHLENAHDDNRYTSTTLCNSLCA